MGGREYARAGDAPSIGQLQSEAAQPPCPACRESGMVSRYAPIRRHLSNNLEPTDHGPIRSAGAYPPGARRARSSQASTQPTAPTWWLEVFPIFIAVPILLATARPISAHAARVSADLRARPDSDARRPLHVREGAARILDGGVVRLHAKSLRSDRPLRPGVRPGDRCARDPAPALSPDGGEWLFTIVTALCLAISACYEFVEWFAAVLGGSSARCVPRARRATSGTRNGTCSWRSSAP